jgi:hypothetical protein
MTASDAWDAVLQDVVADAFPGDQRDVDVEKLADLEPGAQAPVFPASDHRIDLPELLDEAGLYKLAAAQSGERSCEVAALTASEGQLEDAQQSAAAKPAESMLPEA